MSRTIGVRAVRRRKKIGATLERLTTGVYPDPSKTAVVSFARQLAREGLAQWTAIGNGIV